MYEFGFLGLGKMGSSILNGILSKGIYEKCELCFYAPSEETQNKYKNVGLSLVSSERELFISSKIILMAIKPQKYDEALDKIKGVDCGGKIVISLAPGKSIRYLNEHIRNAKIVRAMPNTPALVNKAVTTITFDGEENIEVLDIFKSIGEVLIVNEKQIDEAIPLNGSMPAYLFEFVRGFVNASLEYNIRKEDALTLALYSIIGSCELAIQSGDDLDTLINNVCSKGGSTIAGLNELRNNNFNDIIKKCYDSCVKRSKDLESV